MVADHILYVKWTSILYIIVCEHVYDYLAWTNRRDGETAAEDINSTAVSNRKLCRSFILGQKEPIFVKYLRFCRYEKRIWIRRARQKWVQFQCWIIHRCARNIGSGRSYVESTCIYDNTSRVYLIFIWCNGVTLKIVNKISKIIKYINWVIICKWHFYIFLKNAFIS